MINFYNYLTDKKVSQSIYEMLFDKFMQSDEPTYREYTGTLPVTITANGSDLTDWIIYGNTGGVGDETANLFDYEHTEGLLLGVYINQQGQTIENFSYNMSYFIEVQPNAEYTWNFGSTVSHNAPTAAFYDSNGDYISVATHGQGTYFSFTTPNNAAFVRVPIYTSTKTAAMLNTGSTALPYEPYGYKISILSNSEPVNIYIDSPLGLNETVSKSDTNINIPTDNGTTVISCDNTVQPEKIYIKYIGG